MYGTTFELLIKYTQKLLHRANLSLQKAELDGKTQEAENIKAKIDTYETALYLMRGGTDRE